MCVMVRELLSVSNANYQEREKQLLKRTRKTNNQTDQLQINKKQNKQIKKKTHFKFLKKEFICCLRSLN